jgi:predicted nucleic acid-binding protein
VSSIRFGSFQEEKHYDNIILDSSDPVLEFIQSGAAQIAFDLNSEISAIRSLMARYANVPMSLADACLVRMSELHSDCLLLTTDSDFSI